MALDVKIKISMAKPIGNIGFGYPLILEVSAEKEIAYTEVTSLEEVITAGYANTTDTYKAAQLMFMQEHAPEKIAVCSTTKTGAEWLAVESNVSKEWRQLVVLGVDEIEAKQAIASAIEAQTTYPKMFYSDHVATSTLHDNYNRTVLFAFPLTEGVPSPVAALVGEVAGCEVGSYTLNNMKVKGVTGQELSATELEALHEKNYITYVLSAGDTVVSEGFAASGEFVDNTDNNDWIKAQLEYKIQKVLNNNLKVPYTNAGIAMLESAATSVMADAVSRTMIDNYTVNFALRENTTAEDRAARRYIGGNIKYEMAGAIHTVEVTCEGSF